MRRIGSRVAQRFPRDSVECSWIISYECRMSWGNLNGGGTRDNHNCVCEPLGVLLAILSHYCMSLKRYDRLPTSKAADPVNSKPSNCYAPAQGRERDRLSAHTALPASSFKLTILLRMILSSVLSVSSEKYATRIPWNRTSQGPG